MMELIAHDTVRLPLQVVGIGFVKWHYIVDTPGIDTLRGELVKHVLSYKDGDLNVGDWVICDMKINTNPVFMMESTLPPYTDFSFELVEVLGKPLNEHDDH